MSAEDLVRAHRILDSQVSVAEILAYIADDPFLTVPMATAYIGHKDDRVIEGAIRRGELRHYRIGKKRILKRSELDAWVFEHEVTAENREADKSDLQRLTSRAIEQARKTTTNKNEQI